MSTLRVQEDRTRLFTTGDARVGDGILLAFSMPKDCKTDEEIREYLKKTVPMNTSLPDMLSDMGIHGCENAGVGKGMLSDDDKGRLLIGYTCEGCETKWRVPLADLKASVVHFPEYAEAFRTAKSRFDLARMFDWQPMKTAPRTTKHVQLLMKDGKVHPEAHFASDLSGEEQPAFEGWFIARIGETGKFLYFEDVGCPKAWREKRETAKAGG
jgi:hypothetical protein